MNYLLLTGTTGLLGRYLLREFLIQEQPIAVLVRPSKWATAQERLEAIMAHWERIEQRSLPRPVVLAGDLNQQELGLDPASRTWVAENCDRVLHSAASMTFREDKHGEPFRTNIQGTQRLVDFCRDVGIQRFHHVSTAYLCGLRTGRILESELDQGQTLGNVYEESKLAAEKLVRAADHLEEKTFYRPASIVGDSQSGYVTSFHGFYLPVQLAHAMSGRIPPEQMTERFLDKLGLSGSEGKNFVPVDWVAAVISYLVMHGEHHRATYHVAAPQTVPARLFQRVVQDAIQQFASKPIPRRATVEELDAYERLFHEHMSIYRSHWRDDPQFDLANTLRAAPHLPCPDMDYELLMRISGFAIENNFGVRKHEGVRATFNSHTHLAHWLSGHDSQAGNRLPGNEAVGLQITGPGGGPWRLMVHEGRVTSANPGLDGAHTDEIRLNTSTLAALTAGELSIEQSIRAGRVLLRKDRRSHEELRKILSQVVTVA